MYSKLVSIIIPVFNASLFIEECLTSVINQTHQNIEIIIVNDGSTDDSFEVISNFIEGDTRFLLINQENKGCSAAKNKGLELVKGDYVQYLDADDILSKDKIEQQVYALEKQLNSIAVCKTAIISCKIDNVFGEINTEMIKKQGSGLEFLLRLLGSEGVSGMVQPNAYLIPKVIAEKIGSWNEDISPSPDEDGEYFGRALIQAEYVIFTEGINYYRKLETNASLSQVYSHQRVFNLIKTVDEKFKHIFEIEKSERTQKLFQLNVSQVAYQFGLDYPELLGFSKDLLKQNKYKKLKVNYPWRFRLIATLIGFESVIRIKKQIRSKSN